MRNYLFDTGVFSLLFSDNLPEKWLRYWNEIRNGTKNLILFEFLISEIVYKNSLTHGFQKTTDRIMQIKSLGASRIVGIEDNEAFAAGKHMVSSRRFGISHVDSYLLSLAKKHHAKIITTDIGVKQACKHANIGVDHLPVGGR